MNLFLRGLNVTFLLILFFVGNFLRSNSAKVSGSIPGHGWDCIFIYFWFLLPEIKSLLN